MLRFLVKIIISALAVMISAYLLPGIGVDKFTTALIVAAVLALLNAVVKPILIVLTIPITIFTLGFFLLVINALMILLTAHWVKGFTVTDFWLALIFSIILSIITSIFEGINSSHESRGR